MIEELYQSSIRPGGQRGKRRGGQGGKKEGKELRESEAAADRVQDGRKKKDSRSFLGT